MDMVFTAFIAHVKYFVWLLIYYGKINGNYHDYNGNNYGNKYGFFFP